MTDDANRPAWQPLLEDLERRRRAARAMGGVDKLTARRRPGRLDARARVEEVCDVGSFAELGLLAGDGATPADAFIAGRGMIAGRTVFVGAEDVTVAGGSIGTAGATKRARLCELARRERAPLVLILEGAGHRATNALHPHRPAPNDLQLMADLIGRVPLVVVVAGPAAGHSALAAPMADHVIMVVGTGCLFSAGPPLVAVATGEEIDKLTLGGVEAHAIASGLVHEVAADDRAALDGVRRFLSYLAAGDGAAVSTPAASGDVDERPTDALLDLIPPNPRAPYDMRAVLEATFDRGSLLESGPDHGGSLITTLARLGGRPVVVVANQPLVLAGALDVPAAEKGARFIERMTAFGLPLILLADNPGMLAGSAAERAGILRSGARMFLAQHRADVPKIHVTIRKAFGFGSSVMGQNAFDRQSLSLAFPTATLGGIPAGVGAATSKADEETRDALVANEAGGPWRLAGTVSYDDVIDPRELRNALLGGLRGARDGPS
ncbi:MAG: carboxyl transferase domain-containing protein [Nocardioides sp.]|uniref:acyl-CoA carboxylase subunit beta n=1 Tax=Nocardioides sp. TaxID=35761 RepID=UPI0039E5E2A0